MNNSDETPQVKTSSVRSTKQTSHAEMDAHCLQVSVFPDKSASSVSRISMVWADVVKSASNPKVFKDKGSCHLIKMAVFGERRSLKGSLRSDENMLEVWGIEGDLDNESLTMDAAVCLLEKAGIEALVYTSPSHGVVNPPHSLGGPRLRVLTPASCAHRRDERKRLTAKLNTALGGNLATESFTASQCYYFGSVEGVAYEARRVKGQFIDLVEGLAETYPPSAKGTGLGTSSKIKSEFPEPTGVTVGLHAQALQDIASGAVYHTSLIRLAASFIATGMAPGAVVNHLRALMDASEGAHDQRWKYRRDSIPSMVDSAGMKFLPISDDLHVARRDYQKRENQRIGDSCRSVPVAELVDIETAHTRYVFMSDGSRVADIFNPGYDLAYSDFANTTAASKVLVKRPPDDDGNERPGKLTPISEVWRASPKRKTVVTRTFKAGADITLLDPVGRLALNTWHPYDRSLVVEDMQVAGIDLFIDHVNFLFPDPADAKRFLDWLAHIEQHPGELPHTGWVHIARSFGMGRNWLASVLTRVWAGNVAANMDLVGLLRTGFNGQLSRKVLAVVDEIREGGSDSQWAHAEKMKSLITEETRLINPKYGRQTVEYNACRWLMFSNHLTAIPMDEGDRRFEVVVLDAQPRPLAYYTKLYEALKNPLFIAAVARLLGKRDISGFSPGRHAVKTESKLAAAKACQSTMSAQCEMLVEHWPSDLIQAKHVYDVLDGRFTTGSLNPSHRRTLEHFDVVSLGRTVRLDGTATRILIIRNKELWKQATPEDIEAEVAKANLGHQSASAFLLRCSSGETAQEAAISAFL